MWWRMQGEKTENHDSETKVAETTSTEISEVPDGPKDENADGQTQEEVAKDENADGQTEKGAEEGAVAAR